jgi:hypothetical protein
MITQRRALAASLGLACLLASGPACSGPTATLLAQDQFLVTLTDDSPPPLPPAGQVARAGIGKLEMSIIVGRGLIAGTILRLKLFEAREWRVMLDHPLENSSGQGWTGHIDGQAGGRFVMQYTSDGHFSAMLRPEREGAIEIGQCREGRCVVRQFNPIIQINCPVTSRVPAGIAKAPPTERSFETIDLLVLYTDAVVKGETAWSDPITARTDIQTLVNDLNTTMSCSVVNLQIRLVGTEAVVFREGDISSDLHKHWIVKGDAAFNMLMTLRGTYGADLVSVIEQSGTILGEAVPYAANAAYKDVAINVVRYDAAAAGVFGHEIGHNLGAGHEKPYGDGFEARSHGLVIKFGVSEEATVMVHAAAARVNRFSNPDACHGNLCTGIRGEADNAGTLNLTAHDVANFRPPKTASSPTKIACEEDLACPASVNACSPIANSGTPKPQ